MKADKGVHVEGIECDDWMVVSLGKYFVCRCACVFVEAVFDIVGFPGHLVAFVSQSL